MLRRKCSTAKEQLLGRSGPDSVPVTILGGGRGIVGGGASVTLTREEVVRTLLDGFLPMTAATDVPSATRRAGLRELGLPFESEPAITRHLAAFLTRAQRASPGSGAMAWPDAVLFNGGFFAPAAARERVIEVLTAWSGKRPLLLENERPEASVAIGAAFYGRLRSDPGRSRRLLIRAGSARAYYIGVAGEGVTAVCVMPRGTQEGTHFTIDRDFTVIANEPSAFTLYSAMDRDDPAECGRHIRRPDGGLPPRAARHRAPLRQAVAPGSPGGAAHGGVHGDRDAGALVRVCYHRTPLAPVFQPQRYGSRAGESRTMTRRRRRRTRWSLRTKLSMRQSA